MSEDELCQFLSPKARGEVRIEALRYVNGLAATDDGCRFLMQSNSYLKSVCDLIDTKDETETEIIHKCLINFSTEEERAEYLITATPSLIHQLISLLRDGNNNKHADLSCKLASNLTRSVANCRLFLPELNLQIVTELINLFCQIRSEDQPTYHYLALLFCNLTQLEEGRRLIFDTEYSLIQKFFPFTTYPSSDIRRIGAVGVLRNCCFDTEYHEWLLSDDIDIMIPLLLPLVGPDEFLEEMELLPLDLQYLGDDKIREPNPAIRKMLIEAITQLCATKHGRAVVKLKQAYIIMRELHKWEPSVMVKVACENLVDILIGDEPEPGMENLKEVEIPAHLIKKFENIDKELLKE